MSEPIEHSYFGWLRSKILSPHSRNYDTLVEILYRTEFVWVISGDKNREEDGLELRQLFLNETGFEKDDHWFSEPCSLLEFFIAFANRASFQTDSPVSDWFRIFMANLSLDEYRQVSESDEPIIEEILYNFVWRIYEPSGYGGLFPLDNPEQDQVKLECWYQFCAWVDEKELI